MFFLLQRFDSEKAGDREVIISLIVCCKTSRLGCDPLISSRLEIAVYSFERMEEF